MLSNKMNSSFLFEDKPHLIRGRKTKKEALKSSTMGAKEKAKEKEREKAQKDMEKDTDSDGDFRFDIPSAIDMEPETTTTVEFFTTDRRTESGDAAHFMSQHEEPIAEFLAQTTTATATTTTSTTTTTNANTVPKPSLESSDDAANQVEVRKHVVMVGVSTTEIIETKDQQEITSHVTAKSELLRKRIADLKEAGLENLENGHGKPIAPTNKITSTGAWLSKVRPSSDPAAQLQHAAIKVLSKADIELEAASAAAVAVAAKAQQESAAEMDSNNMDVAALEDELLSAFNATPPTSSSSPMPPGLSLSITHGRISLVTTSLTLALPGRHREF
jgi:hypothetical protein